MPVTEEKIRSLMLAQGITSVAELAERSGINRTHLYNVWRADGAVTLDTLRKLARTLRVKLGALIDEDLAPRVPTPYDRDEDYRLLVSGLEQLDRRDRIPLMEFIMSVIDGRFAARETKPVLNLQPFPEPAKSVEYPSSSSADADVDPVTAALLGVQPTEPADMDGARNGAGKVADRSKRKGGLR